MLTEEVCLLLLLDVRRRDLGGLVVLRLVLPVLGLVDVAVEPRRVVLEILARVVDLRPNVVVVVAVRR